MTNKSLMMLLFPLLLIACSSNDNIRPLPEGGPTSAQIVHGQRYEYPLSQTTNNQGRGFQTITPPNSMSSLTSQRLQDLNEDFKRVPNPQILGYVSPHFNQANMPVPGYFTVFRLYKKDGYALFSEDAATGLSEVAQ